MPLRHFSRKIQLARSAKRSDKYVGGSLDLECSSTHSATFSVEERQTKKYEFDDLLPRTFAVRFDLSQNCVYTSVLFCKEEMEDKWYTTADYECFKRSFLELVSRFHQHDRHVGASPAMPGRAPPFKKLLEKSYKLCCKATTDDPRTCLLEPVEEEAVREWLHRGGRRGVVRLTVYTIHSDKASRRSKLVKAVLATQAKVEDPDARTESIRRVAEEVSRPSRLFAYRLAF